MNVIDEYSRRHQFARTSQWLALVALIVSLSCFWLTGGAFATLGEKIFWAAGTVFLIAFLVLAVSSIDRYRCPHCFKSLGVVRFIAYCPYCGIQLQSTGESYSPSSVKVPGERRNPLGGIDATLVPSGGIFRRQTAGMVPQGTYRPLASDFPEETYPKDIRLFTTSDEMELTRRYFRLIAKDEDVPSEGAPEMFPGDSSNGARRLDKESEAAPRWRNKEKKRIT